MAIPKCEYACPAETYTGCRPRPEGVIVQGEHFIPFTDRDQPSGCQLYVFNDGVELPIKEFIPFGFLRKVTDITCVGPGSPDCPKAQGFELVSIPKGDGESTKRVARKVTGDTT